MAHKKGQGSSRNGRDSNPSYLGLKVADGQSVLAGTIILKQRGTKFHPGFNVRRANDDSLFVIFSVFLIFDILSPGSSQTACDGFESLLFGPRSKCLN